MSVGLYSGVSGLALGTGLYKNVSGLWGGASGLIDGFGGGSPFSGASLYLNFLAGAPLDSRVTFSRGSNATLVDSTGKITYASANFFTFSEQFDNAAWLKIAGGTASVPVVTANAGTAPDGTETADRVQMTLNGGTTVSDAANVAQAAAYPAGSILQSIWLRSNTGANQNVYLVIGNTQPGGGLVTVTPTWQRFAVTQSVAAAGSSNSGIRLRGTFTGDTADILVWGAQLEPVTYQTTAGTYNPTTTAAYYGPRFDYDPVTLAAKGLLIEEQRTNLLTYSQEIGGTNWLPDDTTVALNSIAAPNGTLTASTLTDTATNSDHRMISGGTNPSFTVGASYTLSVYVKNNTRNFVQLAFGTAAFSATAYANFDVATGVLGTVGSGTTASITAVGSGWYRCTITAAATVTTSSTIFFGLITSATAVRAELYAGTGSSLYVWGAQLEAGAFATSYIPTVASQVTRSADVATMTGTNFSSWYNQSEGTFVASADTAKPPSVATANFIAIASDGTQNERVQNVIDTSNVTAGVVDGNVSQANFTNAYTLNQVFNSAIAYKVNDFAASFNGGTATTDTSGTIPTVNRMTLGSSWDGANFFLNGHIRQIAYYNTRLTNATLQTLTAPSLATTLGLSFTNQAYTVGV